MRSVEQFHPMEYYLIGLESIPVIVNDMEENAYNLMLRDLKFKVKTRCVI